MRKWTYLVASLLLAGATPMFTGCIDNDEPEGITILRGAKAELLKAQAAVEAARVAEVEANAALTNAKAKVQEAKAANELAQAKINEAIAKQEEMKAQILETKDALKKAELERQLQVWENKQKEWENSMAAAATEAEQAMKDWELAYKMAEVKYQKLLVELAIAKNTLTGNQQTVLAPYIQAVDLAQAKVDEENQDYLNAYREFVDAQDKVEFAEAHADYYKRQANWNLQEAQAALAGNQEALAEAQKNLEEAQNLQNTDLYKKKLEVVEKLNQVKKELADLYVQKREAELQIDATEGAELDKLWDARKEANNREIEMPAFTVEYGEDIYPWGATEAVNLPKGVYHTYDVNGQNNAYTNRLATLSKAIEDITDIMVTENGEAWSAEIISRLEAELKEANDYLDERINLLKQAQEAYQIGDYPNTDPSKIDGYWDVDNTRIAFNKAVDDYNKGVDDLAAAEEALTKVEEEYQALKDKIHADMVAEVKKLEDGLAERIENGNKTIDEAQKAFDEADGKLDTAESKMMAAWDAFQDDGDNMELFQKAVEAMNAYSDALEAQQKAQQALEDATNNFDEDAIKAEVADEIAKKKSEYGKKADEARIKYEGADNNSGLIGEAKQKIADIEDTLEQPNGSLYVAAKNAGDAVIAALDTYRKNAGENVVTVSDDYIEDAYSQFVNDKMTQIDMGELTTLDRDELEKVIVKRAKFLYGNDLGEKLFALNPTLDPATFDFDQEIIDKVAEAELTGQAYFDEFDNFGAKGAALKIQKEIELAEALVNGGNDALTDAIETIQAEYDRMKAEGETAVAVYDAADQAWELKNEEIALLKEEAAAPYEAKKAEKKPLQQLLKAINSSLDDYLAILNPNAGTLEGYITSLENIVKFTEKAVYDAETTVQQRQIELEEWNSGNANALTQAERALENAQIALDNANRNLTTARTRLDAILQQLSVDGLTTSEGE